MHVLYTLFISIGLFVSSTCIGQKFAAGAGVGFGGIFDETAEGRAIKGLIFINGFYHLNEHLSLGVEIGTAGNFSPVEDNEIMEGNRIVLSPFDTKTTMILAKAQYLFGEGWVKPYAAIGIGENTYFSNIHVGETDKVSKVNFAFMPEMGVKIDDFSMAMKYLFGGKTPEFIGMDDSGNEVSLASERISIFYFTLGYTFSF